MDNQNLPADWSACNNAISSDFANSNIFWFSNESVFSDGQVCEIVFFFNINYLIIDYVG